MSKYELLKRLELTILCILVGAIILRNYALYQPEAFYYGAFVALLWGSALLSLVNARMGAWSILVLSGINLIIIAVVSSVTFAQLHPENACLWNCYANRIALYFAPDIFFVAILIFHCQGLLKKIRSKLLLFIYDRHVALWIVVFWLLSGYMQPPYDYVKCMLQSNGKWQGGWDGACLITYSDGGKVCSKASDCQAGACVIPGQSVQPSVHLSGKCPEKNFRDWGCLTYIDDGKVLGWSCLDG